MSNTAGNTHIRQLWQHLRAVLGGIIIVPVVCGMCAAVAVDHLQDIHFPEVGPASCRVRHHPVSRPYALRRAVAASVRVRWCSSEAAGHANLPCSSPGRIALTHTRNDDAAVAVQERLPFVLMAAVVKLWPATTRRSLIKFEVLDLV